MKKLFLSVFLMGVAFLNVGARAEAGFVGSVYAGYSGDDAIFMIVNTSNTDFTNVVLSGTNGALGTSTIDIGTIAANSLFTYSFGALPITSGNGDVFTPDYDDSFSDEVTYQVTIAGGFSSSAFSPSSNASGGYVDFLGLKNDFDFNTVLVANIGVSSVPEPSSLALMGLASMIGIGFGAFRRRRVVG